MCYNYIIKGQTKKFCITELLLRQCEKVNRQSFI